MNTVRIVSRSSAPFSDRVEAGELLGRELQKFRGQSAVVLGIPRGGVIVAREVARALQAELDIMLSRKLGAPGNPELAIGAISEDGKLFLNTMLLSRVDAESRYIQQEKARQLAEIERRTALYRNIRPKVPLEGKLVIVTDDGVATGATMQAALWTVRQEGPKKLIAALPVGPEDTVMRLANDADELICLRSPPLFEAIGQFYKRFDQVGDEAVVEILKEEYKMEGRKRT
ncbi:MAG: phosphoribosyltransferase [Methanophagales archaeon ANME-1-THS]|nr:MAG: phosphoribosyltransferase [Methanophagales archaeon ANME-1-THS]